MRPNFATNSVLFEHYYRLVQICSQEAQNIQINEYFLHVSTASGQVQNRSNWKNLCADRYGLSKPTHRAEAIKMRPARRPDDPSTEPSSVQATSGRPSHDRPQPGPVPGFVRGLQRPDQQSPMSACRKSSRECHPPGIRDPWVHRSGSVALLIKRRKLAENGAAPLTLDGPLLPSQKIGRRTTSPRRRRSRTDLCGSCESAQFQPAPNWRTGTI
ncbi:hypothetical protein FG94_01592 [Massilia sp. LC238]|jgi:hypothetical protein|nr:hypothetical protein FG94_01592 [Massilia sp. LC238]